jgi:hypothetical protein
MTPIRYATIVLGVVAATLAAAWPVLAPESRGAVLTGAGFASVNTVAAYVLAVTAIGRSPNVFVGAVLGGMVVRMGVMLLAFVAAVRVGALPAVPLALSLLGYFVAFLLFELTVLHRRMTAATASR